MGSQTFSVLLAWQIAANEAIRSRHEFIEPEHLLLGLFKLEYFSNPARILELGLTEFEAGTACSEISALMELFARHNLDPVAYRRELRQVIAIDVYRPSHRKDELVHRSPLSRQVFANTDKLAEKGGFRVTTAFHLLAALLETPNVRVAQWLADKGINTNTLNEKAQAVASNVFHQGEIQAQRHGSGSVLSQYGKDLTQLAVKGEIHQAIGRKQEMLQIVRTLSRETKNNPLLIGDPGVGKTAVVEGLAWRIAKGNVPEAVRDKRIVQISVVDMIAGTTYRGEFEERVQNLIREIAASPDVILFIDEIHTIVGAGGVSGGSLDAANIFKPALARGELRCIGATTTTEFHKYFEKDPAFERRFQPITIEEPTPEETIEILTDIQSRFAERHAVAINDEVLHAAVKLSTRFLPDRRLPDKAIDLLDEACARARISRLSVSPDMPKLQIAEVTSNLVAEVVSEWTGIPVAQLSEDERERLLRMGEILKEHVIGQDQAVDAVAEAVQRARAGLKDPDRPVSVMLFLGPTGVGKTELAKATAEFLFGSEKAMTRLDMSEFMEKYTYSRLIGSPPGYVGYEEEGQLTGALRRKPFSIVLLDEIEKAHPEVHNIFLQVFDDGRLTDAKGRTVDASNALFVMTSNIGFTRGLGFRPIENNDEKDEIFNALKSNFRPEFINRIDEIVVFRSLDPKSLGRIARLMLRDLGERLAEQGLRLEATEEAIEMLVQMGYDEEYGARPLRRAIEQEVEDNLGGMILRGEVQEGQVVVVDAKDGKILIQSKEAMM